MCPRGVFELVEIRAVDLRFTADEASAYLNEVMGLSSPQRRGGGADIARVQALSFSAAGHQANLGEKRHQVPVVVVRADLASSQHAHGDAFQTERFAGGGNLWTASIVCADQVPFGVVVRIARGGGRELEPI